MMHSPALTRSCPWRVLNRSSPRCLASHTQSIRMLRELMQPLSWKSKLSQHSPDQSLNRCNFANSICRELKPGAKWILAKNNFWIFLVFGHFFRIFLCPKFHYNKSYQGLVLLRSGTCPISSVSYADNHLDSITALGVSRYSLSWGLLVSLLWGRQHHIFQQHRQPKKF